MEDPFIRWLEALMVRHTQRLTIQEIRRGIQALSSLYVERRDRIGRGSALDGAGKRAAFACYFGPLHFLLVREIVRNLGPPVLPPRNIFDLGCGTGVAGAAWALETQPEPKKVIGLERNPWAAEEARWTYSSLGIRGVARSGDLLTVRFPADAAIIAAFSHNETPESARHRLRHELLTVARRGVPVLIVEPIAKGPVPWWSEWTREFIGVGGAEKEWRFHVDLPEPLALLDKAAGLRHRALTGRSLWHPGRLI